VKDYSLQVRLPHLHSNMRMVLPLSGSSTDDVQRGVALHAPYVFPGFLACELFGGEEVHFSPLLERCNKYQTAQMFRYE